MKRVLVLIAFLLCAGPAWAETFEEAVSLFEEKNYAGARQIAEPLASSGDPRAMAMMGAMALKGLGAAENIIAAHDWFKKAAEKNHPGAQFSLAMMYFDGSLQNADVDEGLKLLEQSANGGNAQAQYNLGLFYTGAYGAEPDWPNAVGWFTKGAEQGLAEAQFNLGLLYLDGKGVEKNVSAAASWLSKAALQGLPEAALEYGVMVYRGDGVERNEAIGAKWLLVSANRGNPIAQNRLARIYQSGKGLPQDVIEAAAWNILAKAGGRADIALDNAFAELSAAQQKKAKVKAAAFKPVDPGLNK